MLSILLPKPFSQVSSAVIPLITIRFTIIVVFPYEFARGIFSPSFISFEIKLKQQCTSLMRLKTVLFHYSAGFMQTQILITLPNPN